MNSEQSKPISLDERDAHSFFCIFGRYEPAVALGIIVMLSVWALFIILHRTVRGQRRKKDENSIETEVREVEKMTIKEERRCSTESTEKLKEDISKAQDNSDEEHGEVVALQSNPGLGEGAIDELSGPVFGDHQSNAVPESRDPETACWDMPLEHKVSRSKDLCAPSALSDQNKHAGTFHQGEDQKDLTKHADELHAHSHPNQMRSHTDHESVNQVTLKEPASDTEEESNHHPHLCENMEALLAHVDHDAETEKKAESLYANLETQQDLSLEEMKLSITEEAIKNQPASGQQNDLSDTVDKSSAFQKSIHSLDSSRDWQLEETSTITEINVMETTMKSPPEILSDCQHLHDHSEHLPNPNYHGLVSSLCEHESDRNLPLSDPPQVSADGEISESKADSLDCSTTLPPEEKCEKTEINIMEATMDYNEWMNGGTAEMNKSTDSSGKVRNGSAGLGDAGMAEQCLKNSADSTLAKVSISKESGATFTLSDGDSPTKRAAAIQPMPQTVAVSFRVHYITHSPLQFLAVTGNQQELGNWEKFVPLSSAEDGFWAGSVSLPAGARVEWKFVVVEDGRVQRWEECSDRQLQTGHEQVLHLHEWWGFV